MIRNVVTKNQYDHILNNGTSVDVSMKQDSITVGCTTVTMEVVKWLLVKHALHFPEVDKEVKIQLSAQTQLQGVDYSAQLAAQTAGAPINKF